MPETVRSAAGTGAQGRGTGETGPEDAMAGKKKAPPEGGAKGVEAGFIQARNLSSSGVRIRSFAPRDKSHLRCRLLSALSGLLWAVFATVQAAAAGADPVPAHGLAMHGEPALAPGFTHLPYADPDAPTGGVVVYGETGGFDSLNPYTDKGRAPWSLRTMVAESLMARSWDEPFTLYGLLAESVRTPADRSWVEFTLRREARFSDGTAVTVDDVIFSMRLLGEEGHPRYRAAWEAVDRIEATGSRSLRITFSTPNRELPLLMGLRPVLKRAEWEGRDIAESSLEPFTGSGPYLISDFEPGRFIEFRRNPDYWGRDLGVNRGLDNFDLVRFEYFRDAGALWEAFTAGQISVSVDHDPVRWGEGYDFPAALDGRVLRAEIPHNRPSGMHGFVFNTRRAIFADRRVREALTLAFEWINARLYGGAYARITSYWANSDLAFHGPAEGREREILAPFDLPPGTLETGWTPPVSDGRGRNRVNLRAAGRLLDAAGWQVREGVRVNAAGEPFAFEILVSATADETLATIYAGALERLGIEATVRRVDDAQFQARRNDYDYDMTVNR
ncbi:MAG: extracellular solute-binding protein, partial [Myxococcota bacterium]